MSYKCFTISCVPSEDSIFLRVNGWLKVEDNLYLGKVYLYAFFVDHVTQKNPNSCVKDAFLDI